VAEPPRRAEVERFLASWQSAIANKDYALYRSLGLPGNEDDFHSNYANGETKLGLSLLGIDQASPDELMVRVQFVLETGSERVDEERKLLIRQTPDGLRYGGEWQ
jgi:hypothetical protein